MFDFTLKKLDFFRVEIEQLIDAVVEFCFGFGNLLS